MRVELNEDGYLTVYAQSGLEAYALRQWSKEAFPMTGASSKLIVDARTDQERGGFPERGPEK